VIEPTTVSFENEFLIGILAILPRHGCENDSRIAVGNQAKIANNQSCILSGLGEVRRTPAKPFRERGWVQSLFI
jgi:hypothetical protein